MLDEQTVFKNKLKLKKKDIQIIDFLTIAQTLKNEVYTSENWLYFAPQARIFFCSVFC